MFSSCSLKDYLLPRFHVHDFFYCLVSMRTIFFRYLLSPSQKYYASSLKFLLSLVIIFNVNYITKLTVFTKGDVT